MELLHQFADKALYDKDLEFDVLAKYILGYVEWLRVNEANLNQLSVNSDFAILLELLEDLSVVISSGKIDEIISLDPDSFTKKGRKRVRKKFLAVRRRVTELQRSTKIKERDRVIRRESESFPEFRALLIRRRYAINHLTEICKGFEKRLAKFKAKQLDWTFLPVGFWPATQRFANISERLPNLEMESLERLEILMEQLNPNGCYVGLNSFDGYIAFTFEWCRSIVLENPHYGNATYVLPEEWIEMTKMSKWELRRQKGVEFFIHTDDWLDKLYRYLRTNVRY